MPLAPAREIDQPVGDRAILELGDPDRQVLGIHLVPGAPGVHPPLVDNRIEPEDLPHRTHKVLQEIGVVDAHVDHDPAAIAGGAARA